MDSEECASRVLEFYVRNKIPIAILRCVDLLSARLTSCLSVSDILRRKLKVLTRQSVEAVDVGANDTASGVLPKRC